MARSTSESSLVGLHGFERRQVFLLRLDDVFALVCLFSGEVERMLEESEDTVFKTPIEIAMAVIAGQRLLRQSSPAT
jgi:hypothetical protein